jgi:hypothetical protein
MSSLDHVLAKTYIAIHQAFMCIIANGHLPHANKDCCAVWSFFKMLCDAFKQTYTYSSMPFDYLFFLQIGIVMDFPIDLTFF